MTTIEGTQAVGLGNENETGTLGRAAHEFVAARFDWATIVPRLEAVYSSSGPH